MTELENFLEAYLELVCSEYAENSAAIVLHESAINRLNKRQDYLYTLRDQIINRINSLEEEE